jgi:hypothetical protein
MINSNSSMLTLLFLLTTIVNGAPKSNLQPVQQLMALTMPYNAECKHESATIEMALRQLSSGNYNQIQHARNTFLNVARHSNICRNEVVHALMKVMDKPNLDFERQPSDYYLWREGSQLLGELKATEALDLLISHLDMNNGFHSASMVFQPAVLGVRLIGQAAIPKLALALQRNPQAGIRMAAAHCLTSIGGESAMNALRQAQESESNPCVANFILVSLKTFTYKSKSGISFGNKAPQANEQARQSWLLAFRCVE